MARRPSPTEDGDVSECMSIVRRDDPDRYVSALYAPASKRPGLFALDAFACELAAARSRVSQPLPGEIRLQWWRDRLEQEGSDGGGNPVARALLATVDAHDLPTAPLIALSEARIFDLYDDPFEDRRALEGYFGETKSALIQLSCMVLDADAASSSAGASGHGGCAYGAAEILRDLPLHRARGQCFVPTAMLQAVGSDREDFLKGPADERADAIVAAVAAFGREHLRLFRKEVGGLPRSLRPAFLPLASVEAVLKRAENVRGRALTEPIRISPLSRNLAIVSASLFGFRSAKATTD